MRKTRIPVYVTSEELQAVRMAAAGRGMSMSEYVRAVLFEALARRDIERQAHENEERGEYKAGE